MHIPMRSVRFVSLALLIFQLHSPMILIAAPMVDSAASEPDVSEASQKVPQKAPQKVPQKAPQKLPQNARGETPAMQQLEEIQVLGSKEHVEREKTPIQKMRETLDQYGKSRADSVVEATANDGARYAQINMGGKIYCMEERRGAIDISGMNDFSGLTKKPPLMSPAGKKCRTGQY